jgi:hypothetical protein
MPGVYRLDIPNVVIDTAGMVTMYLRGATNMAPVVLELEVVAIDIYDTVRLGLTAIPNVATGVAGALITSGTGTAQLSVASGLVTLAAVTHTGATIPTVTTVSNRVSANTDQWNAVAVTGMPMPTYVQPSGYLAATFPLTVASTTNITAGTIATVSGNVNGNVSGSVGSVTGAVGSVTGNVSGSVASVVGAVGSVTGAVGSVTSAVTVGTINANVITATSIATDAITSAELSASAVQEIADGVLSRKLNMAGNISDVSVTSVSSATFTGANTYIATDTVQFLTTAPTSFALATKYYVIATSLTATTFQLSATSGGSAITTVSTGAFTVVPIDDRTVRSAFRYIRNKVSISSSTMTITTEDDATAAWTAALTTTPGVDPVTAIDPA